MSQVSRRQFFKISGLVAAGASLGSVLSACGGTGAANNAANNAANAATEQKTNEVIIAMNTGSEPAAGFNPCVNWGCGEHVHEPLIQSTLITTDLNLKFVGDLAKDWNCSSDGMTWTFNLRDDVKFTDGEPLTASDVAFTINTINSSDQAEADLSMVKEAVATSKTQVELHMAKPNNALLYTLAVVGIVPEHAYNDEYGTKPIGSGRYMLEQWNQGQQVIFVANPDYYGEAPKMERVTVVFMSEDASLAAAKSGTVDIAFTSAVMCDSTPSDYNLLACKTVDSRGISLPTLPSGSAPRVGMDGEEHEVGNDVTADLAIRQAMNYGVDRELLVKNVLSGYGTVAYSVGDGLPWSSEDMKVEFDFGKAQKILADGGWAAGSDGILTKNGLRASFELLYASNDSVRQAMAVEFSNQMAKLGIEVTVKGGSWDTDLYPHQFDTPILWGWGSNAPVELYELTYSTGWGNVAVYDNAEIDAALDAALAAPTFEESYDDYKKAQWNEKTGTGIAPKGAATWVWLANVDHLYFERNGLKVAQQKPHPHGHGWSLANNVDQWTWE